MPDLLGYVSSAVLVFTIGVQIRKQWTADSCEGVSPWLFVGQAVASTGFLIYSVLIDSLPFVITNAVLAAAAVGGFIVWFIKCRDNERQLRSARSSSTALA